MHCKKSGIIYQENRLSIATLVESMICRHWQSWQTVIALPLGCLPAVPVQSQKNNARAKTALFCWLWEGFAGWAGSIMVIIPVVKNLFRVRKINLEQKLNAMFLTLDSFFPTGVDIWK